MRRPASRTVTPKTASRPPLHVVVVGGGFGGLTLTRDLARAARKAPLRITLIDRRNHHTFQPLLYQVATAGLQPQDIGVSLRAILRRYGSVDVRLGEVVGVDRDTDEVVLADGGRVHYDRLVIAAGAVTQDYGIEGVAEHGYALKSLADATTLRNEVLHRFELASADPTHLDDGTLTFVLAGGGPTGVELAGTLSELVELVLKRDHPELDTSRVRIVLVELLDRLLPGFSDKAGEIAERDLRARGVDVRTGVGIAKAAEDHVELTDDEVIPTRTLVWAAGIGANPLGRTLGVDQGKGGTIPVDDHLRVVGFDGVHAIGDIAASVDRHGQPLPQVAPVAIQQGQHVAEVLVAEASGTRLPAPFRYRDKGSMATIGRASAVVDTPWGWTFGGVVAWVSWLLLHLLYLAGFKNRASVLASWIWNYATYDHAARLILEQREAEEADTTNGKVRRRWAEAPFR